MKNTLQKIALLLFVGLLLIQCESHKQEIVTQGWPEINSASKPWARWWWMGNAVNKKDIEAQLTAFCQADFGGIEITPIYGVMGYEDQYIDYLSDEWMDMLQFTITKADELGLGVDMNLGTGWPFGGPQITPEFAASILLSEKYTLKKGEKLNEKIVTKDPRQNPEEVELLALTANLSDGNIMDIRQYVNDQQKLDWVPEQDCEIYAAFNGKTGQKVKRAAPGGEGWSMDHFSKTALEAYLERFDAAFSKIPNRPS